MFYFLAGDEVKADAQIKMNSLKSHFSTENKITNVIEHESTNTTTQHLEVVLNKRKLEDDDEKNGKKLKAESEDKKDIKLLNGDISSIPSNDLKLINTKLKDEVDEVETKILNSVNSLLLMLGKPKKKIQITKSVSFEDLIIIFINWFQEKKCYIIQPCIYALIYVFNGCSTITFEQIYLYFLRKNFVLKVLPLLILLSSDILKFVCLFECLFGL